MAKSKSGGTRSYLRGRIASDVYSIGRDANGKKQQVVRSLAETVKNPQTPAQMKGRAIMSTVMQAVSGLAFIVDHSFDNVANGQPSISEFIRRNYALIKADVEAHPASGNTFGINKYQEKGVMPGAFQVSFGAALDPAWLFEFDSSDFNFRTSFDTTGLTAAQVREAMDLSVDDYITLIAITYNKKVAVVRLRPSSTLADDTQITLQNFKQLFDIEQIGDLSVITSAATVGDSQKIALGFYTESGDSAVVAGRIVTKKIEGGFIHSTCTLVGSVSTFPEVFSTFDVALPTYPIGEERFLNGGDI